MNVKEQYQEFLAWLKAKHKEIVSFYWDEPEETRHAYRRLLLKIQAEVWATEKQLREINA